MMCNVISCNALLAGSEPKWWKMAL